MTARGAHRLAGAAILLVLGWGMLACARQSGPEKLSRQEQFRRRELSFSLIDEGKRLDAQGSHLLALERFNRALRVHESPRGYLELGQSFERASQDDQAAIAYQQALRLAPDYQEARLALLALGYQPEGAKPTEKELAMAAETAKNRPPRLKLVPSDEETTAGLTAEEIAARREKLLAKAGETRQPTVEEIRDVLFAPQRDAKNLPSATKPMFSNKGEVILATYAYHQHKGEQYRDKQDYQRATVEFASALEKDPTSLQTRLDLGDALMKLERYPRARFHFEQAMKQFPASARPYLKMGNYHLALKERDAARAMFRKATEKDPLFVEAYNNLAVMAMQDKNYDEAVKILDLLIERDPNYANAYLNRGIIAGDIKNDKPLALKMYKKYVELEGPRANEVRGWIRDLEKQ